MNRRRPLMLLMLLAACGDDASSMDGSTDAAVPSDVPGADAARRDTGLDASADAPRGWDGDAPDDGRTPLLSGFRVTADAPDRVYFDAHKPIQGSDARGFTVAEETITGLVIVPNSPTGHYFQLAEALDYWDNKTIRYEGGSDVRDLEDRGVIEFTLSYIDNLIPEPEAPTDRFVTTEATGGGDGTSEASAWTLAEAFGGAEPGTTVWVKAGEYGHLELHMELDGTATSPIKFVGYRDTPGDISSNYWDYTTDSPGDYATTWSAAQMPTLTGSDRFADHAIWLDGANYVVFRNLQIRDYLKGFRAVNTYNTNLVFDRINGWNFGGGMDTNASLYDLLTFIPEGDGERPFESNSNLKLIDNVVINCDMAAVAINGDGRNLVDGCKTYSDKTAPSEVQDYHIALSGHYNIIRRCHAENFNTETHATSHGIGIRGGPNLSNTYNLIEQCAAINLIEGLYVRNLGCDHNVIKDSYVGNNDNVANYYTRDMTGGVFIWGGSNFNTVERVTVEDCHFGLYWRDLQEEPNVTDTTIGRGNVVRNCVFNRTRYSIYSEGSVEEMSLMENNTIVGNTFNESEWLFYAVWTEIVGLEFVNNIITNHDSQVMLVGSTATGIRYRHNAFFGNGGNWHETGDGNVNVDPRFVSDTDLHLSDASPAEVREGGETSEHTPFDYDGSERTPPYSIGAYER